MRGATLCLTLLLYHIIISTHAPHARCDSKGGFTIAQQLDFNSRTSCEVRQTEDIELVHSMQFQLTHLMRGATAIIL